MFVYSLQYYGRVVYEKGSKKKVLRKKAEMITIRQDSDVDGWNVKKEQYVFQPQRFVDTFGNGVYSPSPYFEGLDFAKMPEFEYLPDAIAFMQHEQIFGDIQRYVVYIDEINKRHLITAGVVYSSEKAPVSMLTALTQKPKSVQNGGTTWIGKSGVTLYDLCSET